MCGTIELMTLLQIIASVSLLALAALFSGLTFGYLALSLSELKRKAELGHKQALLVYPLRKHGNQLLVTLVIGNTLVNAALTVVLNTFLYGVVTVIVATILITVFAEILPQAYLRRYGLKVGAFFAPMVKKMMDWTSFMTAPAGRWLDRMVGDELPKIYGKRELLKILDEQMERDRIESEDLSIAKHALSFADKNIKNVMVPLKNVVAVKSTKRITTGLLSDLHETGHTRFPVYGESKQDIIGVLYARDLATVTSDKTKASELMHEHLAYVNAYQTLEHALNAFLKTKHHMFVVIDEKSDTLGIITIEDIIDQALGTQYEDEFDDFNRPDKVAELVYENTGTRTTKKH